MSDVPASIAFKIINRVRRDLDPGLVTVVLKSGLAILLGGFLSLLVCGQFGLGITGLAQDLNHTFHLHAGGITCSLICGSLFSVIPVLLLRTFSGPMQFKVIIKRKWIVPGVMLSIYGNMLAYHGNIGKEFISIAAWIIAAWAIYLALGYLVGKIDFRPTSHSFQN